MPGSYVYAMAADGGVGNLMRVVEDEGDEEVLVEYLSLDKTKAGRKASKGPVFVLERVGGESAWLADPTELWTVDHLVTTVMSSSTGRVTRVKFDYAEANQEISRRGGMWREPREAWAGEESPGGRSTRSSTSAGRGARSPDYSPGGVGVGAYSPYRAGELETRLAEVELEEAVASVQDDAEKRHSSNRGPEGRVPAREPVVRGGAPEGHRFASP